jgi:hypothetical protein
VTLVLGVQLPLVPRDPKLPSLHCCVCSQATACAIGSVARAKGTLPTNSHSPRKTPNTLRMSSTLSRLCLASYGPSKQKAPQLGAFSEKNPLPESARGVEQSRKTALVPTPFTSKVVENRRMRVFWLS